LSGICTAAQAFYALTLKKSSVLASNERFHGAMRRPAVAGARLEVRPNDSAARGFLVSSRAGRFPREIVTTAIRGLFQDDILQAEEFQVINGERMLVF
jgi:hypothetical protein